MTTPLRIGILGAARIADDGIVDPAKVLGHELVAVAARDRGRAEAFAAERGVAKVHDTYQDVIDDPDVEVVYNALVNSLHARWNVAALQAGKHVLSEKPITSNAAQARALRRVAAGSRGQIVEGFHYLHHPVHQRLRELVTSGQLGVLRRVEIVLAIPAPADSDPRWSWELAGGDHGPGHVPTPPAGLTLDRRHPEDPGDPEGSGDPEGPQGPGEPGGERRRHPQDPRNRCGDACRAD